MIARIESLYVYPIKSCRGIALERARLCATGFERDREWMLINEHGRFVTQRELSRLALVRCEFSPRGVRLSASGAPSLEVADHPGERRSVVVWRDTVEAVDSGDEAARWFSSVAGAPLRLVRLSPDARRVCNREWTGDVEALAAFSDGYPLLAISEASLADLNSRLPTDIAPLPMNRFRPNVVLTGLGSYDEDRIHELRADGISMRVVKPCTRCKITTIDQESGVETGEEPLKTLKSYRWSSQLRGVTFGQNVIAIDAVGHSLHVGQELEVVWR